MIGVHVVKSQSSRVCFQTHLNISLKLNGDNDNPVACVQWPTFVPVTCNNIEDNFDVIHKTIIKLSSGEGMCVYK